MKKSHSSAKQNFLNLLKSAFCALVLLISQSFAVVILCARNIWPDFEYEQIIANANIKLSGIDILNFSPEIKYYLLGGALLYLIFIGLLSNKNLLKLSGAFILIFIWQLRIIPYYYYRNTYTDLYEKYYQVPEITAADFPQQKRNLLLIYLESVESNFNDKELYEKNLLPQLTELAQNNPHFSNYTTLYGTNYTKAALVAGLCGIPYITPTPKLESIHNHLKNLTCISDILEKNGYETWFAKSADHKFAYTDLFYKSHGYKNVIDGATLTQNLTKQEIEKNKSSYGGLSDKLLFNHILNLFQTQKINEPFLFTMFTVDTHVPGTVLPYNCQKIFGDVRDNILCSDKVVTDFINKFKQTPYWENTRIVILGDHPMFKPISVYSTKPYKRSIYNVFLNTPQNLKINSQKAYTTLDLAPTYLELLDIKLPEHIFGLGRSLFAEAPSLITNKDYKLSTSVRQKSKIYQKFSQTSAPKYYPYQLGTELNNNNITSYAQFSEQVLNHIFINGLGLKLEKLPSHDLKMDLTFNAMLSTKPCLTIKLNTKVLKEIELEKRPGTQTISIIVPKEKITSTNLNLEFINNNFRSAVSQSINIQKLVIKEIQ